MEICAPWQPGDPSASPTTDIDRARSDLREFGYCVVDDILGASELAAIRTRLVEQAEAEIEIGVAFEDQGPGQDWSNRHRHTRDNVFTAANGGINQRLWMLVNKGVVFRNLVTDQRLSPLVESLLGPEFVLSSLTANIAKPGGRPMGLHTDQWWLPRPLPRHDEPHMPGAMQRGEFHGADDGDLTRPINPPCAVNVVYCLNDFTEANGATRLVPTSHLTGLQPPPGIPCPVPTLPAEAGAGSAIVWDGRIWHGTGANQSSEDRLAVLATFCGPQFRPQENYTLGVDPDLLEDAPRELLDRLGFRIWNAYGRVGHPYVQNADPEAQLVGELAPKRLQLKRVAVR